MRRRRKKQKLTFKYKKELLGLLLIIFSVVGFFNLGLIGNNMKFFATLLFGVGNYVFLVLLALLGLLLFIKGKDLNFWSIKVLGLIIAIIGILVFLHLDYILEYQNNSGKIFFSTFDDIMSNYNNIIKGADYVVKGGGIIGGVLTLAFAWLFAYQGTKFVAIIFIIVGIVFFTGFSISDFLKNSYEKSKRLLPKKDESKQQNQQEQKVIINDNNALHEIVDNKKIYDPNELKKKSFENKDTEDTPFVENQENENYILPPMSLLKYPKKSSASNSPEIIEKNIATLERTLREFGIIGKVVEVNSGPTVTQYEMELQTGTKLNKLTGINKELSLALAKKDVRIQAPIPGKSTVGIEIPNESIAAVSLREILDNVPEEKKGNKLLAALGKNIMGKSRFTEIDRTPHLLVAGSTGSGKSVCINCIISSILMRSKPNEVKLMMVDPKKVELSMYNGIPHLLSPVVTDPKKASLALQKVVNEMENRYALFSEKNVKNITSYNEMIDKENAKNPDLKLSKMYYIVVIVDELADLMVVAAKEVEDSIMRIAQMARAAGIHMILATQRPSTDIITGVVKANIPSRLSFVVPSSIDSRTILDMVGAEKLLGKGDMLYLQMGESAPERVQGAYVSDEELEAIVKYTINQQKAQYDEKFLNLAPTENSSFGGSIDSVDENDDPIYDEAVDHVVKTGKASASALQRRFKLGYNRAARIMDLLEERGIVGPSNGSKPREVLYKMPEEEQE